MSQLSTNTTSLQSILEAVNNLPEAGGVELPQLSNPATASDTLSGKEFIDQDGNKVTGTIATKTSSNLTANGATVTVPAGYYAENATKSVATATQATPSVSIDANGKITATVTQTAGYVSAGTKSGTKQLTTQSGKTITPTKSSQTAVTSGVYTTGAVTVAAIPDAYQDTTSVTAGASDVLTGKTIVSSTGTVVSGSMTNNEAINKTLDTTTTSYTVPKGYHNGSGTVKITTETKSVTPTKSTQTITPSSGKVLSSVSVSAIPNQYITTTDATAAASEIFSGETAYVNGSKVMGTFTIDNEITTLNTLLPQLRETVEDLPEAGGVELPTLNNPAGAAEILEGYEAIDEEGNIMIGTHTCASNGDIDTSNFGCFCINVFDIYDPERLIFRKFLAFKLGMTWKEFYDSLLPSFFGDENNIYIYCEIEDYSEYNDGSGPYRFYFYDGVSLNYQYIYNSNNELVQGTDVIQPFDFDTESPVYIANYF